MSNKKELTIEENFAKLEELISKLERDDVSLEDSFKLYNEGIGLVKECNDKIEKVEKQIMIIEGNDEDAFGEYMQEEQVEE